MMPLLFSRLSSNSTSAVRKEFFPLGKPTIEAGGHRRDDLALGLPVCTSKRACMTMFSSTSLAMVAATTRSLSAALMQHKLRNSRQA